jgi:hypothetical protein
VYQYHRGWQVLGIQACRRIILGVYGYHSRLAGPLHTGGQAYIYRRVPTPQRGVYVRIRPHTSAYASGGVDQHHREAYIIGVYEFDRDRDRHAISN